MTKTLLTSVAAALIFSFGVAEAGPRMSLPQAVDVCTKRAVQFAKIPRGPVGEEPEPSLVEQRYRACVYANARQYPSEPPKYRQSILTPLLDALS
ncbi:MAG: hypothetical protein AAF393_17055 [Pseudomonadota bacterium]